MSEPLPKPSVIKKLKTLIIGQGRSIEDKSIFHRLTLIAFFAWIGLGADGLSSSAYGPEEAYLALQGHPHLSIIIAFMTAITIFIIAASYSQIIELFPTGGGGYLVASKLLSPSVGMISGSALLIDYVLTITISVASGADALFSFLPASWLTYKLQFALSGVVLLTIMNLRGVRESVLPLVPFFLVFAITHVVMIGYAVIMNTGNIPAVVAATRMDVQASITELGFGGLMVLLLRAYGMGAGTYTGLEAVSNGLPVLREPKVPAAKRTMRYMAVSLSVVVMGLMFAYLLYRVSPEQGKTLNAVLFEGIARGWGRPGEAFVLITLVSEAAILFVAAQTGFLDGPRVLANMALDRWFPTKFAMLSDRLVALKGIVLMGGSALVIMLLTKGSVKYLVVLYSITVFITFFLSQLGMVRHWLQARSAHAGWKKGLFMNGTGMVLTFLILLTVTIVKFNEGGWITLLLTGALAAIALFTRQHYHTTYQLLDRLDDLVKIAEPSGPAAPPESLQREEEQVQYNPRKKTAIMLVNGFNGLGLHTLLNVIRLFGEDFKNFVFMQVGVVDAGNFKGVAEVERLKSEVNGELDRYVAYMRRHGYYATGYSAFGTDVVNEVEKLSPAILEKFRNAVFFGGQLVFPKATLLSGLFHNHTIFAIQRRFYSQGIPVVILPIRV